MRDYENLQCDTYLNIHVVMPAIMYLYQHLMPVCGQFLTYLKDIFGPLLEFLFLPTHDITCLHVTQSASSKLMQKHIHCRSKRTVERIRAGPQTKHCVSKIRNSDHNKQTNRICLWQDNKNFVFSPTCSLELVCPCLANYQ